MSGDVCGEPRRYFPQQTCELPCGHAGDHEDATHLWTTHDPPHRPPGRLTPDTRTDRGATVSVPPTAETLLEQLRATHHPGDLVDVTACVVAGAKAWHTRIQRDRRDSGRLRPDGQLWAWEDLTPHDQAALVALVGPVVEAALAELGRRA